MNIRATLSRETKNISPRYWQRISKNPPSQKVTLNTVLEDRIDPGDIDQNLVKC